MTAIKYKHIQDDSFDFIVELVTIPESKVTLIDGMHNPIDTIGILTRGYEGVYSSTTPKLEDTKRSINDLNNTKLQTPFEMIYQIFLIEGVTRSFTHQLVRTRLASYVQESMRFLGHKNVYKVMISKSVEKSNIDPYFDSVINSVYTYEKMIHNGISSEDARDILPHGILTSIFMGIPLSSLQRMYAQRMCCQAQPGQWQIVMKQIKDEFVKLYGYEAASLLSAPFERGESCGYRASFDRPCKWQQEKNDNSSL